MILSRFSVFAVFFFSSRRRHTRCALVTGVQTCALPISADGCQALQLAKEYQPDIILANINLPGMDGYALAQALRVEVAVATTAIILLSHQVVEDSRAQSLKAGADDYISQPLSTHEKIGRAHVCTPVTNAQLVARLMLQKKIIQTHTLVY